MRWIKKTITSCSTGGLGGKPDAYINVGGVLPRQRLIARPGRAQSPVRDKEFSQSELQS